MILELIRITHLLFMDDVMIFGNGCILEWRKYKIILDIFCYASGMIIIEFKSSFIYHELSEDDILCLKTFFLTTFSQW